MYPLKFKPALKFYPYGGRRFANVLEMAGVPRDRDVAESWELSDRGENQSTVVNGPLAGRGLRSILDEFGTDLVGEEITAQYGTYFPLLLKFLDCDKRLPAHMHPDDETARRVGLTDTGKAEAWYIVRADPGSFAYAGARPGLDKAGFVKAIQDGDTYDAVMNRVGTTTGETYYVPSGRVHGLDEGNLAFEIQQNSDAGFGWDWAGFVEAGVVTAEDAARHRELAPEAARYEDGLQEQTSYVTLQEKHSERTFCAVCRYFVLERWRVHEHFWFGDHAARFNTITVISGAATFKGGDEEVFVKRGETLLMPAGLNLEITPQGLTGGGEVEFLRCYVPNLERDIISHLRDKGVADEAIAGLGSYGAGNDLLPLLGLPATWGTISAEERAQRVAAGKTSRDETS